MLYIRGKKRLLCNTYIQRNDFKIDQGLDLYFILSVNNNYLTFYLKTSIFLINNSFFKIHFMLVFCIYTNKYKNPIKIKTRSRHTTSRHHTAAFFFISREN